jgi:glyoxylase I family protein
MRSGFIDGQEGKICRFSQSCSCGKNMGLFLVSFSSKREHIIVRNSNGCVASNLDAKKEVIMFATPIHHAAIIVSDLEKSLHFYRDILEWKVLMDDALPSPNIAEVMGVPGLTGRTVILQKDHGIVDGMIELIEISKPKPESSQKGKGFHTTGLRLLSFRVDDIEQVYNALLDKGVTFISPPRQLNLKEYSIKSCFFLDPDDVRIEIIEFLHTK